MAAAFQKGEVNKLTSLDQFKAAINEPGFVVVDCFATWCGPCKVIAPHVEKLAKSHEDLRFYQVDVDAAPDVAQELGVRAMPTFKFFLNGEAQEDVVGANPDALTKAVQKGAQDVKA